MAKTKSSEDQIREAAYHKWQADGAPQGKDQEYWFAAEAELATPPARKAAAKKTTARKPAAKKPAARKRAAPKAKG